MRKPYLTELIRNLHDRLPTVDLITSFSILNPTLLPESDSDRGRYGTTELELLFGHYWSGPLASAATSEWREFTQFLAKTDLKISGGSSYCAIQRDSSYFLYTLKTVSTRFDFAPSYVVQIANVVFLSPHLVVDLRMALSL